jgi:predicted nucleic acid-binding protein
MKSWTLDASVIAAAFFREPLADAANKLLLGNDRFYAPDLIYAEFANVIWKRHHRGEIDGREAARLLADFLTLPLHIVPSRELATNALELAIKTRRTVYDCLYIAAAIQNKAVMVTADRRLVNALANTPLATSVIWLGDTA